MRWTPRPVIVTMGDNADYINVLSYSHCAPTTGLGGHLRQTITRNPTHKNIREDPWKEAPVPLPCRAPPRVGTHQLSAESGFDGGVA